MRAPSDRIVRPTLQCLFDDLGNEVGPDRLRESLGTAARDMANDSRYLLPVALVAVEHIVLDKANLLARDPAAVREPIETITDRTMVKVKTSDRRGALWQDDEGVWWLLAAGRRKDDGPGDFYREIARYRSNSDPIAPTDLDRRYHVYEAAYIGDCDAERVARADVVRALLQAAAEPGTATSVDVFGAVVAISVDPEGDGSEMLSVSFDFIRFDECDRFPVDVISFVPGCGEPIDDWDVFPPLRDGDPVCWYTYVNAAWIEWLATSVELERLVGEPYIPPAPSAREAALSGRRAHRAPASVVTLAYVEGVEITALCGVRFTPHRNPDHFEECSACAEALALLRGGMGERPEA